MKTSIRTQKFGLGDLLGEGWRLYRTGFAQILPIILCLYVPFNIIVMLSGNYMSEDTLLVGSFMFAILLYSIELLATIAVADVVENKVQGQSIAWHTALRHGLSKWLSAVFTSWLAGLIILGLTFLLIVPGVIWSLYYAFYLYVVALRGMDLKQALDYSKDLVKDQWWRVFGVSSAITILRFAATMVVPLAFTLLPKNQLVGVLELTTQNITSALFTVILVVFFLNTDYLKQPSIAAPISEGQFPE